MEGLSPHLFFFCDQNDSAANADFVQIVINVIFILFTEVNIYIL